MMFEFKAHKPNAYSWFALWLLMGIAANALFIYLLKDFLFRWTQLMQQSVILMLPWILLLFLPSVALGLIAYNSLSRSYRFLFTPTHLEVANAHSKKMNDQLFKCSWEDLKEFRFSDFEDNEYFTLVFRDEKNNLILHRATGDFENFFEELKKHFRHG